MKYQQLKSAVMAGLLVLSMMRLVPLYVAAFFSVYYGALLLIPAYFAHRFLGPFFGNHLWKFKRIYNVSEYKMVPPCLIPKDKQAINVEWLESLSHEAQNWLKETCKGMSVVTNYYFINAVVLDTMYFTPKQNLEKVADGHAIFLNESESAD